MAESDFSEAHPLLDVAIPWTTQIINLKDHPHQIDVRLNPVEALELFKAKSDAFDLGITNMTIPQMTGAKLAEIKIQLVTT